VHALRHGNSRRLANLRGLQGLVAASSAGEKHSGVVPSGSSAVQLRHGDVGTIKRFWHGIEMAALGMAAGAASAAAAQP